ncbi:hypothetical protein ZIOFF_014913 [Zingiber officinale]|uniref:Protein FAR1-RELATED SEQUENCE n=1 Tax=Zingiber officinale TaxID=94328 RepID=A0A8J5LEV4_ZINOF|nr:hypothetical protein ZIOFF_014913 [Zingiber officinale]
MVLQCDPPSIEPVILTIVIFHFQRDIDTCRHDAAEPKSRFQSALFFRREYLTTRIGRRSLPTPLDKRMEELALSDPVAEAAGEANWLPKIDMEFKTDEDAYQFYNNYAKISGFSVRKAWINRRASGVVISRTYVCYKEGFQGNKRDDSDVKKPRQNERTGCLAHLTIKLTDRGSYRISEFHPMHNHELVAPTISHTLKSHRAPKKSRSAVTGVMASQKAKIEYLVRQAGGYKKVTFFSIEDAANKSWAPKVDMEFENDEKAYQFYNDYAKRIGFDVRKAWINRKSSGVIISRTYVCYKQGFHGNKKNGNQVQQHRMRSSERTGCHARMTIKLAKNGRYRVSEFHPYHNHELVNARTAHTLKSHRTVNRVQCTEAAEDSKMEPKVKDECLNQLIVSEQSNLPSSLCRNYLHAKRKEHLRLENDLTQFLEQYERMLYERRYAELTADYHAIESNSIVASSRMLRQAANIYTPAVFDMFQKEFELSFDCMVYNSGMVETTYEYKVTSEGSLKVHLVRFNPLDSTLSCSCKKFEFVGIQCRHVMKALDVTNIKELPPKYFLKRWRKDAKVVSLRDLRGLATYNELKSAKVKRFRSLCHIFGVVATKASETIEGYRFIENQSDQLLANVYAILQTRPEEPQFGEI